MVRVHFLCHWACGGWLGDAASSKDVRLAFGGTDAPCRTLHAAMCVRHRARGADRVACGKRLAFSLSLSLPLPLMLDGNKSGLPSKAKAVLAPGLGAVRMPAWAFVCVSVCSCVQKRKGAACTCPLALMLAPALIAAAAGQSLSDVIDSYALLRK